MILLIAFILLYITFGAFLADDSANIGTKGAVVDTDHLLMMLFGPIVATGYFFLWFIPSEVYIQVRQHWARKKDETWV